MWQPMWQLRWHKNNILISLLAMSAFSIQHLTARTILTQYHKVRDQINIVKILGTKLIHGLKVKDQICNLPYFKSDKMQC